MGRAFSDITFTPSVRAMQERMGSREQYEGFDLATNRADRLGRMEIEFISQADHFYQATVSETEIEELCRLAAALRDRVCAWLEQNHPKLLTIEQGKKKRS